MDNSVGATIEKIKLKEQDVKNKLKEQRQHEAALESLNKSIKDTLIQIEKSEHEILEITKRIAKLQPLLEIEKIKHSALAAQIAVYTKEFEELKDQCNRGVTNVWRLRSSLCETVYRVSNDCDIRGLLMRPTSTEPLLQSHKTVNNIENEANLAKSENILKAALQKRNVCEAEREKLMNEPQNGEEFVRQVLKFVVMTRL